MGTVLRTWPNCRFGQIQDGFRNKERLSPIKGAHFRQAKHTKTGHFWQFNTIHLHSHQKTVSMAIERKQFCFSGIDYHKPSVTPFHNTTQVLLFYLFMHFCPGTMTTHAESINSDLQRGLDRHLRHIQHWTQNRTS